MRSSSAGVLPRRRVTLHAAGRATAAIVLLAASGCARPVARPRFDLLAAAEPAAAEITEERLRSWITELADDRLEGRGPGSVGDQLAQQYLVEQMQAIGLRPGAGDGGWQQRFAMVGVTAVAPETWRFRSTGETLDLRRWHDFVVFSGRQQEKVALDSAELVFVGYGIQAPEYGWDDYKGADLEGKVLVMLNNDPDWDPELFAGERRLYYGRWGYKYESAATQGAAGAIIVHTTPSAGYPFQVVQTSWTGEQFELPAGDEPRLQVGAWASEEATRRLLTLSGHDLDELVEAAHQRDFVPVPLGLTTSLSVTVELRQVESANVLGLLPGGDPELGGQVVVFTAHHDHLGIGTADDDGDRIYNGALDNAAGVGQVLAIAKAFAALPEPPRRSVLFAFVAAEEQGLLGSEKYAREPTFPAGQIAANINYDGGNIWGPTHDVTYIGYGKSSLDSVVDHWAAQQGRVVVGDQFPDRGFFYRSDQFNFAKIGVPAIYLDTGTDFTDRPAGWGREQIERWEAVQYHQPSDEIDKNWRYDGMIADARLGFWCGLDIAERDEMPFWVQGDEFEAARLEAIARVAAADRDDENTAKN